MKKILIYLCILALPVACTSPKSSVKQSGNTINLSNMYNPSNTRIHPAYTIYHNSPETSLLLLKIFPSELLYSGTIEPNKLLGQVSVNFLLTDISNPEEPVVADSGKVIYSFTRENADKKFQTQIPLSTQSGKRYQLAITTRDIVRRSENLTYLYIDKTLAVNEQNFLVTITEDNTPVYKPYVVSGNTIKLDFSIPGYDSIYVKYYGKEIPLPKPSFSLIRETEFFNKPDSVWALPLSKTVYYQFNYEGIYYFQPDTNINAGLTLLNFGEHYPRVQKVQQLIEPLAYLATSVEYDKLKKATNQKLAVDNFWLGKAGNAEKARELIKTYYNRVYFANYYFTSHKPGWKTDRGMIFIIYGPPQSVKVTPSQEKWIYYKNNYSTSVTFTFDHNPTSFSADNYTLQRSDSYDTYWRNAVETWRNGNIYLIE
jgi:GWxTD domain-containing protein